MDSMSVSKVVRQWAPHPNDWDGKIIASVALDVSRPCLGEWRRLPPAARWYVGAFFGGASAIEEFWTHDFDAMLLPQATIATRGEVERLAGALSAAFPRLRRRVVDVVIGDRFAVHLECEGLHEGCWHGLVEPTGRRVDFDERHELLVSDGRIRSDRMMLNHARILTQLCGGALQLAYFTPIDT
jgi:predicted ester cyclase